MTLLRGLEVEDLTKPELTGNWEFQLAEMEHGAKRENFMAEIAAMTERIVAKAKEYDRDTIPGDYATLATPCPKCGGVVKENYRRFTCTGRSASPRRAKLRLLHQQDPGGRSFGVSWPRSKPSCATSASARWRAFAPRPAGPSRPSWPWSTTTDRQLEVGVRLRRQAKAQRTANR